MSSVPSSCSRKSRSPTGAVISTFQTKPGWFLDISPLGKVPVLETAGQTIFESQVIAEYLDEVTEGSLHPADPLDRARHRAWIAFGSETLNAIGAFYAAAPDRFDAKHATLRAMFARIEPQVAGPFFAGDEFHMIDAAWGPVFRYLDTFDRLGDFGLLDGLKQVSRWRSALARRPTVASAVPDGYPERLLDFLRRKESEIGRRARQYPSKNKPLSKSPRLLLG